MKDEAKDGDLLVLYIGDADTNNDTRTYVRPVDRFLATVEHEGQHVRRFAWQRPRFEVNPVDNLSIVDNKEGRKVIVTCTYPTLAKTLCDEMNSRWK